MEKLKFLRNSFFSADGLQQIDDLENSNSPIIVYRPDVSSDDNLQYFGAFTSSCISVQQVPLEVHCRGQNLGVCLKREYFSFSDCPQNVIKRSIFLYSLY